MAEINTNISRQERKVQNYKKFKNLSVNEEILPQGDGNIRISPFDDYFLFTLYDEKDGENVPIDLSNVGSIYLSFIGNNDEIKIPNYTNVEDIDMSSGQVLFRISKEDGRKIIELDNNNFYISTLMKSDSDDTESDESVIYTGTFSKITDAARKSLTSQIDEISNTYADELAKLQEANATLIANNEELTQTINEQQITIDALTASNEELTDEITELTKELDSKKLTQIQNNAQQAQAQAQQNLQQVTQIISKNKGSGSATVRSKPSMIRSLAKVKQKYFF